MTRFRARVARIAHVAGCVMLAWTFGDVLSQLIGPVTAGIFMGGVGLICVAYVIQPQSKENAK